MLSENGFRTALSNRTNLQWPSHSLSTERTLKRQVPVTVEDGGNNKRIKIEGVKEAYGKNREDSPRKISLDMEIDAEPVKDPLQNCTIFNKLRAAHMRPRRIPTSFPSRPILASFVSSHKSDVYTFHSQDNTIAPGIPFSCAFSSEAKMHGRPILAVAMQEGVVELIDTSKRRDWDTEPQRTTFQAHNNAILDIKWGRGDLTLATSSGDSTTRISSVTTQQSLAVLAYHKASVKAVDWDPNHADLLSTASRDGSICVWDLRVNSQASGHLPVIVLPHAHFDSPPRGKAAQSRSSSKSVTSLLYLPQYSGQVVSSGSFDGLLKQWDLRYPDTGRARKPAMLSESITDPTLVNGSRARGLSSLALGRNHSAGALWGIAADSCVHTYALPLSAPFAHATPYNKLTHPGLHVKSFYVKVAVSPCGSWLASGSSGGGVYVWDVATRQADPRRAVELKASGKEISAVDWTTDSLAACCDDGTVRIWRPDLEVSKACKSDPVEKGWEWAWASEDFSMQ